LTYTEHVFAIVCPECGFNKWKKHGTVSCSVVPFEAECAFCRYTPDIITNRRLCPNKEFVFYDNNWFIARHLVCFQCGEEVTEFDMKAGSYYDDKTVEFGDWPNESTWILPGRWNTIDHHTSDFDGNPITKPILFCSNECRIKYVEGY
jgi:hypothetical protein